MAAGRLDKTPLITTGVLRRTLRRSRQHPRGFFLHRLVTCLSPMPASRHRRRPARPSSTSFVPWRWLGTYPRPTLGPNESRARAAPDRVGSLVNPGDRRSEVGEDGTEGLLSSDPVRRRRTCFPVDSSLSTVPDTRARTTVDRAPSTPVPPDPIACRRTSMDADLLTSAQCSGPGPVLYSLFSALYSRFRRWRHLRLLRG